jgi:hypothetical protein
MEMLHGRDVTALKDWLSGAWRRLADMSLTSFDRREIRHYMRNADIPLRAGLNRMSDREATQREAAPGFSLS